MPLRLLLAVLQPAAPAWLSMRLLGRMPQPCSAAGVHWLLACCLLAGVASGAQKTKTPAQCREHDRLQQDEHELHSASGQLSCCGQAYCNWVIDKHVAGWPCCTASEHPLTSLRSFWRAFLLLRPDLAWGCADWQASCSSALISSSAILAAASSA